MDSSTVEGTASSMDDINSTIEVTASSTMDCCTNTVQVTAVVTVIPKAIDPIPPKDTLTLMFASSILDSGGKTKRMVGGEATQNSSTDKQCKYEAKIDVAADFGDIGAVIVDINPNSNERYIESIVVQYSSCKSITFSCNSWVTPKEKCPDRRMFFSTKSYLPSKTPKGLTDLRDEDLINLRGKTEKNKGERKESERIYDYDMYNDLGDPEDENDGEELTRPVLGGSDHPYPRRCRTGRKRCENDFSSEKRGDKSFYVPRDEAFSEVKQEMFSKSSMKAQQLDSTSFADFVDIELLFREGITLPIPAQKIQISNFLAAFIYNEDLALPSDTQKPSLLEKSSYLTFILRQVSRFLTFLKTSSTRLSKNPSSLTISFPPPEGMLRDKFNWLSDIEFARQTLAGVNPYCIQLVKSLPLKSLPIYENEPQDSKITIQVIRDSIGPFTTVEDVTKVLNQKRLYVLDYHDILLQYVTKVRKIKDKTLYGSRTLFFLNEDGTLRPLAIELTRPAMDRKDKWTQVFTPSTDATDAWLWRMAKAHVLAHDSCFHQLIVHWLRTHCAVEPYVIATNRQLSTMHPIYRLLHPHFRFTMRINSNAREVLINAGGIIENTFSTAKYSMELSSLVYDKEWEFNLQALPEDLIHRGMAERDTGEPHGLKLAIEDYPFANDGLILWDALKEWVTAYVKHYYTEVKDVEDDEELQAWWKEIKEKGHPDKMGKPGWPNLKASQDLIDIITIIVWVACGHHSAVNFGQYAHSAFFPNRPSIARTNMPVEDKEKPSEDFINKPEQFLLQSFPSVSQAVVVASTMHILSTHSEDEEYLGKKVEKSWDDDSTIKTAFTKFQRRIDDLGNTIDDRNANDKLKNRRGAGHVPYELLKPTSKAGVTEKGLPYSIST